jgi:hypothetical protein
MVGSVIRQISNDLQAFTTGTAPPKNPLDAAQYEELRGAVPNDAMASPGGDAREQRAPFSPSRCGIAASRACI